MATINYQLGDGSVQKVEFTKELRIGSDAEQSQLVLPAAAGVAKEHAIITRAMVGKLPVLLDLAGHGLRVNGQNVVSLKVLHHGDRIQVGQTELELREMQIRKLTVASKHLCPISADALKEGQEVVSCPNCETLHHRSCWFEGERCSSYGCLYPIQETVIQALSPPCTFVTRLEKTHKLVTKQKVCPAGVQRDMIPFQQNDDVAFCPKCEAALHLQCWLSRANCPACRYDIKQLMDQVFDGPLALESSQTEEA